MNVWQLAQQVKHKLETVAWPGGSAEVVFGESGVYIYAGNPSDEQLSPAFPCCYVEISSGDADEDHPELITQRFNVHAVAEVAGDDLGEFSIIGGSTSELGISAGRGVAELAERVFAAVGNQLGSDGAKLILSTSSISSPGALNEGLPVTVHSMEFTALCTAALHYAAPQELAHAAGDWTWEGSHCSDRFDFKQYRLYSKSGSSPSTAPGDGTLLYTGTPATFTGAATGGNVFTVFADYSSRKQTGIIEGSSGPEVGSFSIVEA